MVTGSPPRKPPVAPGAVIDLAVLYVALLVPTLAFKYRLLGLAYAGGLSFPVSAAADGAGAPERVLDVALFFAADVAETFCVSALLVALARRLAPRRVAWVSSGIVALACLLLVANDLAYRQTLGLLTPEILADVMLWVARDPRAARPFVTPSMLLSCGLLALWSAGPAAFARLDGSRTLVPRHRALLVALVGVAGAGAAGWTLLARSDPRADPMLRGYWTQSATALSGISARRLIDPAVRPVGELRAALAGVAFPLGRPAGPPRDVVRTGPRRPHHVILVSLETAAARYYPLDRASLPTLRRMAEHALVGRHHYSTAPETMAAVYSMVSGTYPPAGVLPNRYGDFESDGLATVLARRGYDTTYVDSYDLDWAERGDEQLVRSLGFAHVADARDLGDEPHAWPERMVAAERHSFDRALRSVLAASASGRKAFVCVVTMLGHYPWDPVAADPGGGAPARMQQVLETIDGLLDRLLRGLAAHGLAEDVVVVVTGDHGPRFQAEFAALGETFPQTDLTYHVPLLIYAPATLGSRFELAYNTSHVDIAPTVLDLCGLSREGLLLHGESLLGPPLRDRAVFLGGATLYPTDALRWGDHVFARSRLTGRVVERASTSADRDAAPPPSAVISHAVAGHAVQGALELFDATASAFLRRHAVAPGTPPS